MSMADPKYDKLYGIARDQPDVYETSDLPEADQPGEIYEEKSDAVERLHISAFEAYSKFQGKELDSSSVDFSDRIGRKNTNGYNNRANNWELAGLGEKETPLQTYNRLKLEIEHLVEDLSNISVETNENLTNVSNNLNISVEATQQLFTQLAELHLEDKIGFDFGKSIEHPEEQQFSKVINHLSNVGKESTKKAYKETPKAEISDEKSVRVMLKFNPNKQMQFISRLTDLEQKLGKLETLIGANNAEAIRLCNVNPREGLISCCQWMVAKLSLLDPTQLDIIESKLSNVNSKLEQCINSQNSLMQDPEKEKKINELYDISEKARTKSELIPGILERMVAIESMHKQGKQSVQMISHLEALQAELFANLAYNNSILINVKENLNSNLDVIKDNIESLKIRVDALISTKK